MSDSNQDMFIKYTNIITFKQEDSRVNTRSEKHKLFRNIDKAFFRNLYYERPEKEERIISLIKHASTPVTITGATGTGKSTIMRSVLNKISKEHLRINFDVLSSSPIFLEEPDYNKLQKYLSKKIKNLILQKYFHEYESRKGFYRFLLAFKDDESFNENFYELREEFEECYIGADSEFDNSMEWFDAYYMNSPEDDMMQLLRRYKKECTHIHVIMALINLILKDERYIILLDNVDRLHPQYQPLCYEFASKFNNVLTQFASIILTIRPENAHNLHRSFCETEIVQEEFLPSFVANDELSRNKTLSTDEFYKILYSRQLFFDTISSQQNEFHAIVKKFTSITRSCYIDYALINLANQSIRNALMYHCEFLRYLMEVITTEKLKKILDSANAHSFLASALMGWIVDRKEVLSNSCLNIVSILKQCKHKNYCGETKGCDLGYLILVNILNEAKGNTDNMISLGNLIANFKIIGYHEEDDIRKAVYSLYSHCYNRKKFGHLLAINHDDKVIKGPDDIKGDSMLSINYRAAELVKKTICSFTFISRSLHFERYYSSKKSVCNSIFFTIESLELNFKNNILFLAELAFLHSLELFRIKETMVQSNNVIGDKWLSKYKSMFCVGNKLQLTRIIESNYSFVKTHKSDPNIRDNEKVDLYCDVLVSLGQLYKKQIDRINQDKTGIFDYESIIKNYFLTECKLDVEAYCSDATYLLDITKYL